MDVFLVLLMTVLCVSLVLFTFSSPRRPRRRARYAWSGDGVDVSWDSDVSDACGDSGGDSGSSDCGGGDGGGGGGE
ncbi:hypothetical protein [Deinococcus pimensis]|uniref:hypothetical protein n=1 Tax=Deinococcus pimensis TaxID=309888 RepID=UPI000483AA71|nr:hypothetical protein [Deinococcus pimensis]